MNIFEILSIRKYNRQYAKIIKQSERKICCESCKFCICTELLIGFDFYSCLLCNPNFLGNPKDIHYYKCGHYRPCRQYKKYLKLIGDE